MEHTPIVFISYSTDQVSLKKFIAELLEDMGFTCLALNREQISSIEEARTLIHRADCFIGLLTPDQHTSDGLYVCQESINIQLGLAYDAKIPMQLFAFDNVDTSNLVFPLSNQIVKMQRFKTKFGMSIIFDALNIRLLFKALLEFRKEVFSTLTVSENL